MKRIFWLILVLNCSCGFTQTSDRYLLQIRKDTSLIHFLQQHQIRELTDTLSFFEREEEHYIKDVYTIAKNGCLTEYKSYSFGADTVYNQNKLIPFDTVEQAKKDLYGNWHERLNWNGKMLFSTYSLDQYGKKQSDIKYVSEDNFYWSFLTYKMKFDISLNMIEFIRFSIYNPADYGVFYDTMVYAELKYNDNRLVLDSWKRWSFGSNYFYNKTLNQRRGVLHLEMKLQELIPIKDKIFRRGTDDIFTALVDQYEDSAHIFQSIDTIQREKQIEWFTINDAYDKHYFVETEVPGIKPIDYFTFPISESKKNQFFYLNTLSNNATGYKSSLGTLTNQDKLMANEYVFNRLYHLKDNIYANVFYLRTDTIKGKIYQKRYFFDPGKSGESRLVLDLVKVFDFDGQLKQQYQRVMSEQNHFFATDDWERQDFQYSKNQITSVSLYKTESNKQSTLDPLRMNFTKYLGDISNQSRPRFEILDQVKKQILIDGRTYYFTNY